MSSFLGYRTHWFVPDVYFKLYLQPSGVAGCRVGGQIISATEAEDPRAFAKRDLLARYPDGDRPPDDHLFLDEKNFWLPREVILEVRVSGKLSMWAGRTTNSGSVRLHSREGRPWRFLLLGRQDARAIEQAFSAAGYPVR